MFKRNKGKAKKANKERQAAAAKEQQEALEAQIAQLQIGGESTDAIDTVECNHGFSSYPPGQYLDKFCKAFIDAFSDESVHAEGGYSNAFEVALIATKDLYPDVWADATKLEKISSFFVYSATGCILEDGINIFSRLHATFACFFENATAIRRNRQASFNESKINDLYFGDERTIVMFLRKRISCCCLDKMYKKVKHWTKMSGCYNNGCINANGLVERSKTSCCSRCRKAIYCSRECQVAHWPHHKERCDEMVRNNANFDARKNS
eukprot:scaffold1874_cov89-Skeletonema_dohrnii-CCMP3373.AAC.3